MSFKKGDQVRYVPKNVDKESQYDWSIYTGIVVDGCIGGNMVTVQRVGDRKGLSEYWYARPANVELDPGDELS